MSLKNDAHLLELVNKIQAQLAALDRKVDTIIQRSQPQANPSPKPPVQNKERMMYKAICADCRKECAIPFKPTGDRPVYCQECFSRRKVMRLSGMKVEEKPQIPLPEAPPVKKKKGKAPAVKKAPAKKKAAPKKK